MVKAGTMIIIWQEVTSETMATTMLPSSRRLWAMSEGSACNQVTSVCHFTLYCTRQHYEKWRRSLLSHRHPSAYTAFHSGLYSTSFRAPQHRDKYHSLQYSKRPPRGAPRTAYPPLSDLKGYYVLASFHIFTTSLFLGLSSSFHW